MVLLNMIVFRSCAVWKVLLSVKNGQIHLFWSGLYLCFRSLLCILGQHTQHGKGRLVLYISNTSKLSPLAFYGTQECINNTKKKSLSWGIYSWMYIKEGLMKKPHVDYRHSIWLVVWTLWPRHLPPAGTSVTSCKKISRSSRATSRAESSTILTC